MLTRNTTLSDKEESDIRRRVGKKFGIKTDRVTRYCKLMAWAEEFEDFHRNQDRDERAGMTYFSTSTPIGASWPANVGSARAQ